jgi:hypothetical protein
VRSGSSITFLTRLAERQKRRWTMLGGASSSFVAASPGRHKRLTHGQNVQDGLASTRP